MCRFCLTRRSLLLAPAMAAALPAWAAIPRDIIEPGLRLPGPSDGTFTVALTLDACPGAFDDRLAAALVESGISATVFVTDLWLRRNPAGLRFFLANPETFALQNHGQRHIPPVLGARRIFGLAVAGDLARVRGEVIGGADAIAAATGETPRWYRAATGFYSPIAMREIEQLGFWIAGYSLNADQGASLPADAVASRIARAVNGDVIVGHINQPRRLSGLGIIAGVRALQRRGARFAKLDRTMAGPSTDGPGENSNE